jgi:gliding motility-associated-like protein
VLNGSGGVSYTWSPPAGLSCTNCQFPVATPSVTTVYTLTVTDANGCTDSDTVTVFVDIACGEIFVPNAFSPNGDNANDTFYVRGNCIKFMQFEIYNRWGEKVFSSTDPAKGWDGTWRGEKCEAATFTYFLRATLIDDTQINKQGTISLVK